MLLYKYRRCCSRENIVRWPFVHSIVIRQFISGSDFLGGCRKFAQIGPVLYRPSYSPYFYEETHLFQFSVFLPYIPWRVLFHLVFKTWCLWPVNILYIVWHVTVVRWTRWSTTCHTRTPATSHTQRSEVRRSATDFTYFGLNIKLVHGYIFKMKKNCKNSLKPGSF